MKLPILTVSALLVGSFAMAQDTSPTPSPSASATPAKTTESRFKKYDKNKDGTISFEEFTTSAKDVEKATAAFKKKDKDGDNKLTMEEFKPKSHAAKSGDAAKTDDAAKATGEEKE